MIKENKQTSTDLFNIVYDLLNKVKSYSKYDVGQIDKDTNAYIGSTTKIELKSTHIHTNTFDKLNLFQRFNAKRIPYEVTSKHAKSESEYVELYDFRISFKDKSISVSVENPYINSKIEDNIELYTIESDGWKIPLRKITRINKLIISLNMGHFTQEITLDEYKTLSDIITNTITNEEYEFIQTLKSSIK